MPKSGVHCLLLLALSFAAAVPALAQDWPQRTVRIINPYAPGTTTARIDALYPKSRRGPLRGCPFMGLPSFRCLWCWWELHPKWVRV